MYRNARNANPAARIGDTVIVRSSAGQTFRTVIVDVDDDIKNGRPGYEHTDGWCYADQLVRIVRRAPAPDVDAIAIATAWLDDNDASGATALRSDVCGDRVVVTFDNGWNTFRVTVDGAECTLTDG